MERPDTPTPQWSRSPETEDTTPPLPTETSEPVAEARDALPGIPLMVKSIPLSRSPAELGLASVSVKVMVSMPLPGVMEAYAAHASLHPPETANSKVSASDGDAKADNPRIRTAPARPRPARPDLSICVETDWRAASAARGC